MGDDAIPLVFLMIALQTIAMMNENTRMLHMEQVIALEVKQIQINGLDMEAFKATILERSKQAQIEREALSRQIDEQWQEELNTLFPLLPDALRFHGQRHPPMLK